MINDYDTGAVDSGNNFDIFSSREENSFGFDFWADINKLNH